MATATDTILTTIILTIATTTIHIIAATTILTITTIPITITTIAITTIAIITALTTTVITIDLTIIVIITATDGYFVTIDNNLCPSRARRAPAGQPEGLRGSAQAARRVDVSILALARSTTKARGLDLLVQRRRDKTAAVKLMRKLLKKHGFAPDVLVTQRSPN